MPVSIHVHHALADGLHVAQFVEHSLNDTWQRQKPFDTRRRSGVSDIARQLLKPYDQCGPVRNPNRPTLPV
jgi:hypothetical protein